MLDTTSSLTAQPIFDHFAHLWALGYQNIVPIIPPGVVLSEKSTLYSRLLSGKDDRGKTPGRLNRQGKWSSWDWTPYQADEHDLKRWRRMGAGVGIVCRDDVRAIDADTLDLALAKMIKADVDELIGPSPIRIGQYPKAVYVVRVRGDFPYKMFEFGPARGAKRDRIEILGGSKHFVAFGEHPKTRKGYYWPSKLVSYDELPVIDSDVLTELVERLRGKLPQAGPLTVEGVNTYEIDQADLVEKLEVVRKAVGNTPNTSEHFSSRESYRNFGYGIKATLRNHPEEAFEIFEDWCSRWADGENEPEIVASDWRRMKPPFRRGGTWLLRECDRVTGIMRVGSMAKWFEPIPEPEPLLFPEEQTPKDNGELELVIASDLAGLPVPEQQWLIKDIIPAYNVTLLGGDGGTGKSLLALQLAEAIALSGTWLGMDVARGKVLYLSAEDELAELHRRTQAISADMWGLHDLTFAPLAGKDAILAAPGKDGQLKATPLFDRTKRTIARLRPAVVVFDTLADLFGGDEVKKIHARSFVSMLRGLALDFELTVILLFHPSVSGMLTGVGSSGNVGWSNSVRSRLYLDRIKNQDGTENDPNQRTLTVKKANRGPSGLIIPLRYSAGRLMREGSIAAIDNIGAEAERVFFKLMDQMDREGRPVSYKRAAPNYAPKVFADHPDSERIGKEHFARALDRLLQADKIEIVRYKRDSKPFEKIARKAQTVSETDSKWVLDGFFD